MGAVRSHLLFWKENSRIGKGTEGNVETVHGVWGPSLVTVAIEEIHVDSPPKKSTMWELLRFIWGKMRTTAPEAAFQRALRTFSKEAGGNVRIYVILVKGELHAARHTFCRRSLLVS